MDSITEAMLQHARQQPARPAILFENQTISYEQLAQEVERFAYALLAWGMQRGERVALFLENSPAFVVAYLGTHLAGGIVVLVNTQYRQVELTHILTDAGVRLCVTNAAGAAILQSVGLAALPVLVVVDDLPAFAAFLAAGDSFPHQPFVLPTPAEPAILAYTSGTTGLAKGALLSHGNLTANIATLTAAWRWIDQDRLLLVLPLFHAHGLMVGLHGTLFTGASAVLRRAFDATEVLSMVQQDERITLFFGVPTMYARLLKEAERTGAPARRLRLFVSGSAPLSAQTFAAFERLFGQRILERYGMTETIMNLTNPYDGERRPGTVGGPFPGQEARIVDARTQQRLPPGEIGEIEVRGPHVFAGYWNRPDATAAAFAAEGWFKTGDLGWCSADGYYTITGRARELIISGGYNVYPREVEDVLTDYPTIAEAAVVGRPDADLGEQVVAFVVPRDGKTPDADDIIAFCRERLASYKKPRRVIFVAALPRNALGKVQKHLLTE